MTETPVAEELRAAASKFRENNFALLMALACPGLSEPLAALLSEAADEVETVLAEEVTLGPDDTYDTAVLDHRHEVRADLTHALAVARAVLGTTP